MKKFYLQITDKKTYGDGFSIIVPWSEGLDFQEATAKCGQPEPKVFKRSSNCFLLVKAQNVRESCNSLLNRFGKKEKELSFRLKTPAKRNAPLSKTSHERVTLALKQERLKCSQFEAKIRMKEEI